jgi:MSHA pilin protein MshA
MLAPRLTERRHRGFTLIELVITIVAIGILAATALPRFADLRSEARSAAVEALAGSVREAMTLVHTRALVTRNLGQAVGTVWVDMDGVAVRVWNGWPDRWWDGIGVALSDASPTSGGYLSAAPYPYGKFTFYGYGNGQLPGGLAGWLVADAPVPRNCSVTFANDGSGNPPVVTATISGC